MITNIPPTDDHTPPPNLSPSDTIRWHEQEAIIAIIPSVGSLTTAATLAGVSWRTAYRWMEHDALGFKARMQDAWRAFGESIQAKALARIDNPDKNRGSDLLVITLLNAYLPERYKQQLVVTDTSSRYLLVEMREMRRKLRAHSGATDQQRDQAAQEGQEAIQEAEEHLLRRMPPSEGGRSE